jgi:hypothetical protein
MNGVLARLTSLVASDRIGQYASFRRRESPPEVRRPWTLRSTMLYQRQPGAWTMLHRHADRLSQRRDLAATLELVLRSRESAS